MKLENIEIAFSNLAQEMSKLKNDKHFDYLVTIATLVSATSAVKTPQMAFPW